jgi:hypothetical protein
VNNPDHSDLPDLRADILIRHFETLDDYANKVYTEFHGTGAMKTFAYYALCLYLILVVICTYDYDIRTKWQLRDENPLKLMLLGALIGVVGYWLFLYMVGDATLRAYFLSPYFMEEVHRYPAGGSVNF